MYPSHSNVRYGIFVKKFEDLISDQFEIKKIVIVKKYKIIDKLIAYLFAYFKIIKLFFTSKKEDIIYVHFPLHFAPILFPFIFIKRKLVLNFHGSDAVFDTSLKKVLSKFLKPIVEKSSIVVPSDYFKGVIINTFKVEENDILVFPSGGVSEYTFYPIQKNHTYFTLGFISNFIKSKGWKILLEAFRIIDDYKMINNLRLIMVGDGPDKNDITSYINKYNLDVKLIDSVKQNELVNIYSEFDVFIFPTYRKEESLGLVGLESMMCGIPVIASNIGGPSGYIKNNINSMLFEQKNEKDLSDKIISFYNLNNDEKTKMVNEAIKTAKLYESTLVSKKMISFLNKL